MPRKNDWLTTFLAYTDNSEIPDLYKWWAGVSTIAACLQRRCWHRWEKIIYPSFYIVLVGPSGCRKDTVIRPCKAMLKQLEVPLCADSITRERLIAMFRNVTQMNTVTQEFHSSLTIISPELSVFLDKDNVAFEAAMTAWFDNPDDFLYSTVSRKDEKLFNLWVNLLGGTTPAAIHDCLPIASIGRGLTSRIIFVWSSGSTKIVPFPILTPGELILERNLIEDLEHMLLLNGEFILDEDCKELYGPWYTGQREDPPITDKNLVAYQTRRPMHLRKLMIIMNVSRGGEYTMTEHDFYRALDLLERTEEVMPNVFMGFGRLEASDLIQNIVAQIQRKGQVTYSYLAKQYYRDMTTEQLDAALHSVCAAFGVVRGIKDGETTLTWIGEKR